jgi:hypothetical protein
MGNFKNLLGQIFGRLTVVSGPHEKNKAGNYFWGVLCNCGNSDIFKVIGASLINGNTTSCGCLRKENATKACSTINGLSKDPIYLRYRSMINRVYNDGNKANTINYKLKGRKVHDSFLIPGGQGFLNFKQEIGLYPTDGEYYTVERVNNDKDYEPGNIKWATYKEQNRNSNNNVIKDMAHANYIRQLYATGNYSQEDIATMENTTQANIWNIVNNKTWV